MSEQELDFNNKLHSVGTYDPKDSYVHEFGGEDSGNFNIRELFKGVYSKLYPLFSIDCGVLVLYDDERSQINNAYLSELVLGEISCSSLITEPICFSDITKEISEFDYPVLKSKKEWMEDFGMNHEVRNHTTSFQFHGYVPIENNGRIYGTLELHNFDRELSAESLTFCCNIADFIAGLLAVVTERDVKTTQFSVGGSPSNSDFEYSNLEYEGRIKQLEKEIHKLNAQLEEERPVIPPELHEIDNYHGIIGGSKEMGQVFKLLQRISFSETTVLILGETGTGKELIAKAIHDGSPRDKRALIKVNCAAIPPSLIESELFGHEKGSFTGATEKRIGKFEQAHNGTIFLDEIGELPLDLQVKLLRVLQEKKIERIGGKTMIQTDVRVISATNRDLLAEVEAGRFRRDLFYRLNVFPLSLPPLRKRKSDIALLATHFLEKFSKKTNRKIEGFSKKAISTMMSYSWPGNVRELEHLVERQVIISNGSVIKNIEIPENTKQTLSSIRSVKTIFENERDHIFAVLELCSGRISGANGAAKLLGVPATTLNSKIKRLGLSRKHIVE